MPLWELQIDSSSGAGWKGWRVELSAEGQKLVFAYDERDDILTPGEAVAMACETEQADALIATGSFGVTVTEIRTVISAEVNPN